MRRDVIRQYEYGRLALAPEIARHGEDEVGVRAEHPGHELLDSLCRDLGPALNQLRTPSRYAGVVHDVGHLGPEPDGLRRHARDDAIRRPLDQVPDERAANTEAKHHELVDAQMIHQTDMVVGVRIPRPVDLERAGRL